MNRALALVRAATLRPVLSATVSAALLVGLFSTTADAHEIGKSQVSAVFHESDFQLDIVVDPDALLSTLEAFAGRPLSGELPRAERDRRIRDLGPVFLERTELRFDGRAVQPALTYVPASAFNDLAQTPSIMRLSGPLPAGAREFDFRYGLALGTYALNVHVGDGPVQTQWIVGGAVSEPWSLASPPPPLTRAQVAWQYLTLGFTHIVPHGLDHILFVLGVFLLTNRWRSVIAQISTFTIAHSITLALTMYGVVSLPARVVEPMIALSIVYIAIENLFVSDLKPWRLALVFSFGLLHGMGFAGVLRDLGLPRPQFLTALVSFNLGVEGGQLFVIGAATLAVAYWRSNPLTYRRFVVQPASILIALTGLFWTVQRVL